MNFKQFIPLGTLLLATNLAHATTPDEQQQVEELRLQTQEDIRDGYAIFTRHHPGMHNPFEPNFPDQLNAGYERALAAAATATTQADRLLAVYEINQALSDGHARMQIAYNGTWGDWPGFNMVWRGDGLLVSSKSDHGPPIGARLISCDGTNATDIIRADAVLGRPDEAGWWWQSADNVFRRNALSRTPQPKFCLFNHSDGSQNSYQMQWSRFPMEEFRKLFAAKDNSPIELTEPRSGIAFFNLRTFSPNPEEAEQYEALFAKTGENINEIARSRAIIIDLRENNGGSSSWSYLLAEQLWGKSAVDWAMANYFRESEVWYLADQANAAHFEGVVSKLFELGLQETADSVAELSVKLRTALSEGKTFFKQRYGAELLANASPTQPRQLPPVFILIDGGCVSACLDAVDVFTQFPNVKLVGAPTSADTVYLETRREALSSGRGSVILPTKIWVNRPRASGEVYRPDILVTDLNWSTDVFLDHIERDLAN